MEKTIKKHLKNMMINNMEFYLGFLFFLFPLYNQAQTKIVQDFNLDNIKDALYYKCEEVQDSIQEPVCKIKIILGKSKREYNFKLEYISDAMVGSYGKGSIYLFDSSKDTEYTQEYNYSKKYDNWILTIDETHYNYENGKIENNLPKDYLLGIDGRKYTIVRKIQKRRSKGRLVK